MILALAKWTGFGRVASGVPWFLLSTTVQRQLECLPLCLSLRMNGVTLSYCYSGIIIPEDSGAVFCIAKPKSPDRLGVNHLDMPRTSYLASVGNYSQ